jgi:two-component system response regulator CpxR
MAVAGGARQQRVLVVDDDKELCQLLAQYLTAEGYAVEAVHDGIAGTARALSGEHAIIVLDIMLPDIKGFEVLRRVRAELRSPILILSARGDEQDRILGLQLGADDYLPKPFNPRELCARLDAILRRSRLSENPAWRPPSPRLVVGDVSLDAGSRTVRRGDEPINVTSVEFELLDVLMRAAGRVVPREELVQNVLARPFSPFDRGIDNHVSNLRRKLGPAPDGLERIKSVRGVGYQYTIA